jgi:hypothetical protein
LADAEKAVSSQMQLAHAATEQGVAMLYSVLGSTRAIAVNIEIMMNH